MSICISPSYLYHTTVINNEKSSQYWKDCAQADIPCPDFGKYHTSLENPKYFTLTEHCDYSSPWMGIDEVFLKYEVKGSLKLQDRRYWSEKIHTPVPDDLDGYIGVEDCVEIYLVAPERHIKVTCTEIPFTTSPCNGVQCSKVY